MSKPIGYRSVTTHDMFDIREEHVPDDGDEVDIEHAVLGRHQVEVDGLGGGP